MYASLSLLSAVFALRGAYAAIYTDPSQLPSREYDYVIVGAGPGGSVVARRLAESSTTNVLIIEAGGLPDDIEDVAIPFLSETLTPNQPWDWNYVTTPQPGLNGRSIDYPRGKLLGGSSCVNDQAWTRGSKDDFDRYARVTGDDGWSWDALQPFIHGIEQLVPPADGHNTAGEVIPSIHGTNGLVGISVQGLLPNLDGRIFNTTSELSEFPFNEDMNSGDTIGISWGQYAIRNGSRQDAANTYLEPASNWDNLDVLINTQVTKVFKIGEESGVPVIRGVQFALNSTSSVYAVNATKEVILSAGAINTPQILLLSGLGPTANLSSLNISAVVDLPFVGSNLQDHVFLPNTWQVNSNLTYDDVNRNQTLFNEDLAQWRNNRTGLFAAASSAEIGWLRLPEDDPIFETVQDPSAGKLSAHYEFIFIDGFLGTPPATGNFLSIATNVVSPTSRGTVTINSTNPFDFPLIDPGLLNSDFDIHTIVEAIKAARRFVGSPAFSNYIVDTVIPANATTDDELAQFARDNAGTVFHPTGTTAMSAWNDTSSGVVNPDLTVKGVKGLRIIDAGILPFVPAAHTQASVYIIAERAAALIKAAASS
ncbi:aryl-alcohol-oxidase from pleurotus Eryingii [Stereum hirsutum FP-91666 SS1]|uniref:aryl-alcohol-oxidase from pleurotus Eryingii n=1 Tax=Stereum hirsutum (strain FP-91666) TaxID=721885 RepID=UPI0004449956|nr:aryl-alcohol-oxidase from pleurotus Eryingii [Stereum hirsutum FP-91666 SS1]EIM83276.1 aryl-alcohol-oxidase from pleurotus Eryingii [Stereum hirsutum FP-91666 SS1]